LISGNNNYNKYWQGVLDNSSVRLYKPKVNFANFTKANILNISSGSSDKFNKASNKKLLICISSNCFDADNLNLLERWLESFLFYLNISKSNCYIAVINDLDFSLLNKSKFVPKDIFVQKEKEKSDTKKKEYQDKNIDMSDNILQQLDLVGYINKNKFDLILNFSKYIQFLDDKFNYNNYAYVKSVDLLQVLKDPLFNKRVLLDVLSLSN
jgi:hypothetical protein